MTDPGQRDPFFGESPPVSAGNRLHPRIAALLAARHPRLRLVRHSDLEVSVRTPRDVAAALGYDEGRITKTLLLKAETAGRFGLAVLPVYDRANLRVVAARMGDTHCAMANPEDLQKILNQPSGGVSPLANEGLPVFLDETLRQYDTVLVGGGTRGIELELSPDELGLLTGGEWLSFSRPSGVTPPQPPEGGGSKTAPKT